MSASFLEKIEQLNQVGIALSAQRDTTQLLEKILTSAQELTQADGGTLYRTSNQKELCFDVIQNTSLTVKLNCSLGYANTSIRGRELRSVTSPAITPTGPSTVPPMAWSWQVTRSRFWTPCFPQACFWPCKAV